MHPAVGGTRSVNCIRDKAAGTYRQAQGRTKEHRGQIIKASKKKIMDKIRSLKLHTRTGSIYVVANLLNPLMRGWQNYYCYFINRDLNELWRFVKRRMEK